jgi:hypothetical protein
MGWTMHVAYMREKINAYRVSVEKPGRHRRLWDDNIKMDLQEIR